MKRLKTLYKEFCCKVEEGSLVTLFFTIGFSFIVGINMSMFTGYPKETNDWISWIVLWASGGAWLIMDYRLKPKMDIRLDVNWENLPPKYRIWDNLSEAGILNINAVINFINRSSLANSIISETYLVSGDDIAYVPFKKGRLANNAQAFKEIELPDVYQPYTAKRYAVSLFLDREYLSEVLGKSDKYWVKFIYTPVNGKDIILTEEIKINDYLKRIYKAF